MGRGPGIYVINLDDSIDGVAIRGGTHWVCTTIDKTDNSYCYFDSYGSPPIDETPWINKYNNSTYQADKDINCGYWCVYIIKQMNRGISFEKLMGMITNMPKNKLVF